MENYKHLSIKLDSPLKSNEKKAINLLNSDLHQNGYIMKFDDEKIDIFLRELNFYDFKEKAQKFDKEFHSNVLSCILNKVESVKSYGIKGNKRNYVDYNKERKVKNRKDKVKKRGQFYYANDNDFDVTNRDCPEKYLNQLILGDSEEVLKNFPDNCIDIIFTSPPYNFGLDYDSGQDDKFWESYFDKLFSIFDQCIRVLKYGGRIVVNVQPLFSDYIPSHHIISNYFIKNKLIWKGEVLWEKNNYNCKYTAWGSWKSPSNPYLKYTWEFLEIFCKGTLKKEGKKEYIDIDTEEFKQWVIAKWSLAPERDMKTWRHPAMFPEKLVERVLKLFSYKNDIVLDPFNGVGTTTSVAKRLNRKFLGIDISKEYHEIALDRTKNTPVQENLL